MLTFIARRIAAGAVLLLVISLLSYVLLSIPDLDVGRQLLGQGRTSPRSTPRTPLWDWTGPYSPSMLTGSPTRCEATWAPRGSRVRT